MKLSNINSKPAFYLQSAEQIKKAAFENIKTLGGLHITVNNILKFVKMESNDTLSTFDQKLLTAYRTAYHEETSLEISIEDPIAEEFLNEIDTIQNVDKFDTSSKIKDVNDELNYIDLKVGEIIRSKGAFSKSPYDTDEQFTSNGWLTCPSCWNNTPVPEHTKFRRKIEPNEK